MFNKEQAVIQPMSYEFWKRLPLMLQPYAYDRVNEIAYNYKAYKEWKKKEMSNV